MPLVTSTEMFKKAYDGGYAIGAFNINNMEIVQAITDAAAELKSPVILQASAGARKYANSVYLVKLVEAADLFVCDHGGSVSLFGVEAGHLTSAGTICGSFDPRGQMTRTRFLMPVPGSIIKYRPSGQRGQIGQMTSEVKCTKNASGKDRKSV